MIKSFLKCIQMESTQEIEANDPEIFSNYFSFSCVEPEIRCHERITKHLESIKRCIDEHGHNPENNFHHFMYCQTKHKKNVFLTYKDKYGILGQKSKSDVWYLFPNGILAPKEERLKILLAYMDYALKERQGKKLVVELEQDLKQQLFRHLKETDDYKALTMAFVLHWPVYNMDEWDHNLSGKDWKKIRNIVNHVENNGYRLEYADTRDLPKDRVKALIDRWVETRNASDLVDKSYFYRLVETGFRGFDQARSILVNGEPATIAAGWKVPNSSCYYSCLGVLDYQIKNIGIYANVDELKFLKSRGYKWVDFGGGPPETISFKRKFKPERIYKTYSFSIVRR